MNIPKKQTSSFLISALILFSPIYTLAAPMSGGSGITVSPAVATISLNSGDADKSTSIGITNNNTYKVALVAELQAVDESNGILVPSKKLDKSLSEIISVNNSSITLEPGESQDVIVTVKDDRKLSPGGTYLALVISQAQNGNSLVGIQSAIGAGIFITKQQGAVRKLSVASFTVSQSFFQKPTKVNIVFKNDGNVQLVPRGVVVTTNSGLTEYLQKGVVNQESLMVFPGKTIKTEVKMKDVQKSWLPKRQKVILQYRFDGTDELKTIEKKILYIPTYLYFIAICSITFIAFGARHVRNNKSRKKYKKPMKALKSDGQNYTKPSAKKIMVYDQNDGEKIPVRKE